MVLIPASIDFETRSGADIRLGLEKYSKDAECEVLTLSYRTPGGEIARWNPTMAAPESLLQFVRDGGNIRGWNVMFEHAIWNNVCVPKYGWPALPLEQCVDTMAQAAAQNVPQALGRCAEVMGLPADQQKSKRGKYLIQKLCVPQKEPEVGVASDHSSPAVYKSTMTRHANWLAAGGRWITDPALFAELCDYCDQDVLVEEALAKKLRKLSEFEQQVWVLTQRINMRGVPVAVDEVTGILAIVEAEKERLNIELRQITKREVLKASNRGDMLAWLNKTQGTAIDFLDTPEDQDEPMLADLTGDTVDNILKRTDLLPHVRRVLEIRSQVCQTSTAKYAKMLKIVADDGTMKNMLVYHGAGPGRWASRGGMNTQNMARPILKDADIASAHEVLGSMGHDAALMLWGDRVMDAAVSCLRGVIKAPAGYEFIDADYSSVENRVGVWLAGQQDKIQMFAKGFDEYKVFAAKSLYNIPYTEVTKDQRQMSKSAVLGCLFGQGAKGLVEYAKGYGVILTEERAKEIVKAYRDEYDQVRQLWYQCSSASIEAVRNPGASVAAGDKLTMIVHRGFLYLKLPSGRLISWARPRVETQLAPWTRKREVIDEHGEITVTQDPVYTDVVTVESVDTYTRQWGRNKLIGSSIFQSAVQGTARDVLANGLIHTEAAGYPSVMLIHDENMALVPEGWGDPEEFGRLMCTPAEWFKDLPLAFEAWRGTRYKK